MTLSATKTGYITLFKSVTVTSDTTLDFDVGSGAKRLSSGQQQKLALARALLKRADLLVLNRPLSSLDGESQRETIVRVLASRAALGIERQTIFWVLSHAEHAELFDRRLEFKDGRMITNSTGAETRPHESDAARDDAEVAG